MKITTKQLKRIIKEEAAKLNESDMGVGMDKAFLDVMSRAANDLHTNLLDEMDPFEIEEAIVRLADQAKPGTALHRMLVDAAQGEDY